MLKMAVLLSLAFGLTWALSPSSDMTEAVNASERLSKVFSGKNVRKPNNMQALLIKLCESLDSCGK